jgi:hypothetical protein
MNKLQHSYKLWKQRDISFETLCVIYLEITKQ